MLAEEKVKRRGEPFDRYYEDVHSSDAARRGDDHLTGGGCQTR